MVGVLFALSLVPSQAVRENQELTTPDIATAELERSLSTFDARWVTGTIWLKVGQPTAAQFLSFQNARDVANFTTTLAKPLPTGGIDAGSVTSTDPAVTFPVWLGRTANVPEPRLPPRWLIVACTGLQPVELAIPPRPRGTK